MPGFLAVLIAKLAGAGTVAKAAIATATAAVTMAVGGGAAGVLPLPGGQSGGVAVQGAVDQATAALGSPAVSLPTTTTAGIGAQATANASVTPPTGPSSAQASTRVAGQAATTLPKLPPVANVATPAIPALPAVPGCIAALIPSGTAVPDPAKLVAQLPACVQSVVAARLPLDTIQGAIAAAGLPVDVSRCLSSVVGSVPGFVGGNVSALRGLLSACLSMASIPGVGSIPGAGSIPGLGSIPGMTSGR